MRQQTGQNESALVCAASQGDKKALQSLLRRNWPWLKGLVYSIVGNSDDIDDVLQDICVRVISKIETLREPERFRPWLAVLARRQALRYRQQKKQKPVSLDEKAVAQQCDQKAELPLENIERKEQRQQIVNAIKSLPEKYRQVFMLVHTGDLTYGQIAEILDVPVTTVQIRLARARRMIYDQVVNKERNKVREK